MASLKPAIRPLLAFFPSMIEHELSMSYRSPFSIQSDYSTFLLFKLYMQYFSATLGAHWYALYLSFAVNLLINRL